MTTDDWKRVSSVLDYILAQPIKESPGVTAIKGEPPKSKRTPKRKEKKPQQGEQLRLF